jgi:uroporphyrin-III C-methyltransferase/precorrin-2 dehydrogenase/sirohydrochlorin ferrochelatase
VVPGISAANGVSSYAGIPLTHRDYAQAVTFVTGHLKDGTVNLDWPALVRPNHTVVIYMGLEGLPEICKKLMEHGLPPQHPIAVVQQGTTRHQRVMTGTLADLPARVEEAGFKAPTLTIVGEVVGLRDKLAWFEPNQ